PAGGDARRAHRAHGRGRRSGRRGAPRLPRGLGRRHHDHRLPRAPRDLTTGQAIDRLRELQPDPALVYYLYVVDAEGKLDGNVSLRDLVVAAPETPLTQVMNPNVLRVEADTPKEEVAALIAKYDLLALPVVAAPRK